MPATTDWEIQGAESKPIFGTAYLPSNAPIGCAIIAHGFKGYKDFRMIPAIARGLSQAGIVAHAFNFSHSGMTANPDTFERPDLFTLDTWNKQVFDIQCVVRAVDRGELAGTGLPYLLVGHSRGGVSTLLFAGRLAGGSPLHQPAGIVTAGSPASACSLSERDKDMLRASGTLASPSARTGQVLEVGLPWLSEQEADPDAHDVLDHVRRIACPILVVHGQKDETVDVASASSIAGAGSQARLCLVEKANHVFNAPNPPPSDISGIPALEEAVNAIAKFASNCCELPR